jgi:hypothetical protein
LDLNVIELKLEIVCRFSCLTYGGGKNSGDAHGKYVHLKVNKYCVRWDRVQEGSGLPESNLDFIKIRKSSKKAGL